MPATSLDDPAVRGACERSADAALARQGLERLAEAHPEPIRHVLADPRTRDALVAIVVASRSLTAGMVADERALGMLRDPGGLDESPDLAALEADLARTASELDDELSALRRWKRARLVRIAARDLLGLAELRTVGWELAAVAQTALGAALRLAAPTTPLAVVGMGKLGGRELNYASDVDVVFVHEGDTTAAEQTARRVLAIMAEHTADGIVFRTDADLRPEGRSGAPSRTLDAYESYWERWAQTWEFQALLKARPVAGDEALGRELCARSERFVFPEVLDPDAVREIRAMKARTEEVLTKNGLIDREVKRGRGGIRDIEFAVQLLQLVHGRHDPSVRSPTTLEALEALATGGYIPVVDARRLDEAYTWLRTVEHRIQLVDEQQTHTIPDDTEARVRLARVLGFRDRGDGSALEQFDERRRAEQAAVRTLHEQIFFAPLLDTLAGAGPLPADALEERLGAFGFRDVAQTRAALRELTAGLTRRSRVMQQLLPVVLGWLSEAPDPDLGLLQLRRLTEGYNRSRALAQSFRESPIAAERTCRVLGASRVLGLALHRQPDFIEALGDDATLEHECPRDALVEEALDTLDWRADVDARREGLRRFKRRHLLRIGARDLLGFADVATTGRELAHLAEAAVEAALRSLEPPLPFAVIGMGRLGGRELSYASDIDVLFVHDGSGPADAEAAERVARRLMDAIGRTTAEGQTFRIDADLRPEGRQGTLARSLTGYREYYGRWALTWEFQSLLRARAVAGDADLGRRFGEMTEPFVYRDPFPAEEVREVRRLKARVEKERIPPGDDPEFHLKLGRGSLSDVEFTVQLLQLQHGAAHPSVRGPSTHGALRALGDAGLLDADDVAVLEGAYDLCERVRNYRYLLTGTPGDSLPVDRVEAEQLGRMVGYLNHPQTRLRDDYKRVTRRARKVVERVFYGREQE